MRRAKQLVIAVFLTLPLLAQHHITRIDVRGDVPANIVISQSALRAGGDYSDADLDAAMARLRRLPFVFDARSTVEGETLVIDVSAVRRYFGELDGTGAGDDSDQTGAASFGGGARLFFRPGGVAEARVTEVVSEHEDASSVEAAYAHYGIARTRLYAGARVHYAIHNDEGIDPDPTLQLFAGYPLTIRQTISATYTDEGFSTNQRNGGLQLITESRSSTLGIRWTWETSDDPFFALRGTTVSAGPAWTNSSFVHDSRFTGPIIITNTTRSDTDATAFEGALQRYWTAGSRSAVFSGLMAATSDIESRFAPLGFPQSTIESRQHTAALTLGYAHNFFDRDAAATTRQRFELGATYARSRYEQAPYTDLNFDSTSVTGAWVLRHPLTTARLTLTYVVDADFAHPATPPNDPYFP